MTSLEGVALVTGGGAGLGRASALMLGKRGARVAVHYMKSRDGAEDVVAQLKAAGAEAASFQADLRAGVGVTSTVPGDDLHPWRSASVRDRRAEMSGLSSVGIGVLKPSYQAMFTREVADGPLIGPEGRRQNH